MKKQFTTFLSSALLIALLLVGFAGKAQTSADSVKKAAFVPSGKLWGYAFGDFYYKAHSDSANRGGSNQYTNVAKNRNGFQLRRVYLGYDYDISKKFSAELLLAAEDNVTTSANTGTASATTSGDLLTDNKISFYIKLINLRWKNIFNGTDLVFGQVSTPSFALLSEKVWSYRSIERTVADIRRTPSFDLGAALQGTFDPATKNYGYNVMVGNGQSAKPENDSFKWFYGDVWAKFLDKKLILDLYADYQGFGYSNQVSSTLTIPNQSRSMIKGFVAYTTPQYTVGVEAFTNTNKGGALTTTLDAAATKNYVDVTSVAVAAFVRGAIIKDQLGFFARYDNYNPNNNYNTALKYTTPLVSQYDSNTKEQFITAGLDFTPAKNIHIMPNVWYNSYKTQVTNANAGPNGSLAQSDYDLVYRLTAFFTFGK